MKRTLALIALGGALIIGISSIGAAPAHNDASDIPSQIKALHDQVTLLQSRIESLEKQVRQMTAAQEAPRITLPRFSPELGQPPEGSRRFEYNGMPFYVCPLQQNAPALRPETK